MLGKTEGVISWPIEKMFCRMMIFNKLPFFKIGCKQNYDNNNFFHEKLHVKFLKLQ